MGGMKSEKMEFDKYGKPISKDKKDKDKDRGGMFGDIDFEAMTQGSYIPLFIVIILAFVLRVT